MKKIVAIILTIITVLGCMVMPTYAENEYPQKRENFSIRDPYVLVHDGRYYMYGTGLSSGRGYGCVVSENLEDWSYPIQVFTPDAEFDGIKDFWAPECHYYNGKFYLFATYYSAATEKRGVGIFVADEPTGPFVQLGDGHITPHDHDSIDGTLYVDGDGQPWMVYVSEWTSNPDEIGDMAIAKLSPELDRFISEPKIIFRAEKHLWSGGKITDGPFLYRTENGRLLMLWSNTARRGGYAVGVAWSNNNEITGKWKHQPLALYRQNIYHELDGGHGMIFKTLDGQLMLSIHSPNSQTEEHRTTAVFIPLRDTGNALVLDENYTPFKNFLYKFVVAVRVIYYSITNLFIR